MRTIYMFTDNKAASAVVGVAALREQYSIVQYFSLKSTIHFSSEAGAQETARSNESLSTLLRKQAIEVVSQHTRSRT